MQNESPIAPVIPFDPLRETAQARIKILEHAGGGKEFILPALRNFQEKISFSIIWLVMAGLIVAFGFMSSQFTDWPALIRFFVIDHLYDVLGILGVIQLLLTFACLDMWLRSSRIVAMPGELRVVTHWLFLKKSQIVSVPDIIEARLENNASDGGTLYFDIVVLTAGEKPGWLAKNFPMRTKPGSSFNENAAKSFNSGGKRIVAATNIKGKDEAEWLLAQLRAALGVSVENEGRI